MSIQRQGVAGKCSATIRDCKFSNGSNDNHYETLAEAVKAGNQVLEEKYGIVTKTSKKDPEHTALMETYGPHVQVMEEKSRFTKVYTPRAKMSKSEAETTFLHFAGNISEEDSEVDFDWDHSTNGTTSVTVWVIDGDLQDLRNENGTTGTEYDSNGDEICQTFPSSTRKK